MSIALTVAVPTRGNGEPLLHDCLRSILAQTASADEVLVVDNGGGGVSLERTFGSRVRVLREAALGVSHARNRAVAEARGEIIAFIDDDVRVEPGWLAALRAPFTDPAVLAAGGPIIADWECPPPAWLLRSSRALGAMGVLDLGPRARDIDAAAEFLVGGNMACRRSAILGGRGFQAVWPCRGLGAIADDYELSRRLAREGRVVYAPAAAVRHRIPRRKCAWAHVLGRVYTAEAARTVLGGRLNPRRGPRELLSPEGLIAATVVLGHLRARLFPRP